MDIKGAEDKLNQVDSLLTTLTKVLKKHWILLLLILAGVAVYYCWTSIDEEAIEPDPAEQIDLLSGANLGL